MLRASEQAHSPLEKAGKSKATDLLECQKKGTKFKGGKA